MKPTPTHLNYYHICHRKLWLFAHGITMEHNSDTVYEGKLIGETTYPQRTGRYQEIDLGIAKIDFYDPKEKVVHEVKKSDKMETAHRWQVKYYIYLLQQTGLTDVNGILEYPKLRKTEKVYLEEGDIAELETTLKEIENIIGNENCPSRLTKKTLCRSCSYFEFCYAD
jgi:CRISPR-associated exonuclease Cas4